MKITVTRSWLPWGRPSIHLELADKKVIGISGTRKVTAEPGKEPEYEELRGKTFDAIIIDEIVDWKNFPIKKGTAKIGMGTVTIPK